LPAPSAERRLTGVTGTDSIEVDGLRIAYARSGHGSPLVLLHGILQDSRAWARQLDALSDEFTVVAWDAPGCGRSSDPPESFRMPDFARCLAGFVDGLGLPGPHLLGLSLGGALALQVQRQRPGLARTLVLASAYAGWAGSLPAEEVAARLGPCLAEADGPPEQVVARWMPTLFPDAAPPELVREIATVMSGFHPVGYRAMAHSVAEADLRDGLADIDVPTLLLYGDRDPRAPLRVARDLHDRIPGSTLVVLHGVGHLGNIEAADRFNEEVRRFLRAADGVRPG
jgi:pimeloyl-ACP methyl ester carboxylesterase